MLLNLQGSPSWYFGIYWGSRLESPKQGARRLAIYLKTLRHTFPQIKRWFSPLLQRRVSPRNEEVLEFLFAKGFTRGECGKKSIPELGYTVDLVGSPAIKSAYYVALDACLGGTVNMPPNRVTISLASAGPAFIKSIDQDFATALLHDAVRTFQPDCGRISSMELDDAVDPSIPVIEVGWMTYRACYLSAIKTLPRGVTAIAIDKLGDAYFCSDRLSDSLKPESIMRAKLLYRKLDGATWEGNRVPIKYKK